MKKKLVFMLVFLMFFSVTGLDVIEASPSVPAAPTGLSATVVSGTQVNLTWDYSTNGVGFKIERRQEAAIEEINIGEGGTSFSDTGLTPDTTYTYCVQAYDINTLAHSDFSELVSVTTVIVPESPSNLEAAVVTDTRVSLTWTDTSNNETGFKIERKTSTGAYSQIAAVAANSTSFLDTGLTAGSTYTYRVRAYNAAGDSNYSNEATVFTGKPTAPTNLVATTVSTSRIDLNWTDTANNETGFKIERRTGSTWSQVASVGANATTYSDTGLSANITYYYRVRAYNTAGDSSYSSEASAITAVILAPSNLAAATVSNSQIDLTWTDNSNNETGFRIERKISGGSYSQIATVGANLTTYEDKNLSNNTTYYYRVRAYNSTTNSTYSGEAIATTGVIPAAPLNLAAETVSTSQINLTWTDNSNNETGFRIERKISGGSYSQIAVVGANVKAYSDKNLSTNTTYYYRVRAYNSIGNSTYSNEASAGTGVPAAPTQLTASAASSDKIVLTWANNSNNETGFKIERKQGGGNYVQIATVGANTRTYPDTNLSSSTTYYYRVRSYNSAGNSGYSNEANAATQAQRIDIRLYIGKTSYYVGSQRMEMDTTPIIADNRTLLPIRYVAEAIGASVVWNPSEQKTTIILKGDVIELWVGNNTARVNGQNRLIDSMNSNVKPLIIPPGRIMLPLRFISENLGCTVDWNPSLQEAKVTYTAP
ncbi:MAG: fibronectin type III domain-containing protein [Bacillota bacterium]|nr:fibronectin type III domain-containing protein [Bacillota bacterium]